MKVLLIGSGGREHALGWKLKQSPKVEKIYFAPGNAGTAMLGENVNIDVLDIKSLLNFAKQNKIDLTVVGPDDPLANGIVNAFQKEKFKIFGPTKEAAQIEWSKAFAKKLMKEENIPTASFETFTDFQEAKKYALSQKLPLVVKASGLALGKGVIIGQTKEEIVQALENIMIKKIFGNAGDRVVIEEYLSGKEISIHAFCDGKNAVLFPTAQDHKPIFDGNRGPNTGGMGTIAPVPWADSALIEQIKKTIIIPVLNGLKKRGQEFKGVLYPGLMITKDGPKVLEFNARFGDPETQSYMRLLKSDLVEIFMACVEGRLSKLEIEWENKSTCCIVLASQGYPGKYQKGEVIYGLDSIKDPSIQVFHAGTALRNNKVITNGGRVLGVTATGSDLPEALKKAYQAVGDHGIHFTGMQYRTDIGKL